MANEKTLEILKKMKADPKAKELFEGMEKPTSPDEAISAYAQVAEKLGYGITAEDIREAVKQEETIRKAKTDKVVADMEELKDDDLEGVAGGTIIGKQDGIYHYVCWGFGSETRSGCAHDFIDDDCGNADACEWAVVNYYNCPISYHTSDPWG